MTEREHCEAVALAAFGPRRSKVTQRLAGILALERAAARDQALEEAALEAEKVRKAAHELAMEQATKAGYLAHQGVSEGADAVVGCIRALKAGGR